MTRPAFATLLSLPEMTVLPSQFFAAPDATPGQKLRAAVLESCLGTIRLGLGSTSIKRRVAAEEEWAWIDADDWHWPFSFVRVCQALKLDPEYVRRGIRANLKGVARGKKLGPGGEVLPRGVQTESCSRTRPYRVTLWTETRPNHHWFATLEEAIAFHASHRRPPKVRGVNWHTRPVYHATKNRHLCVLCAEEIAKGQAYRISTNPAYQKAVHDECWQRSLEVQAA